MTQITHEQAQAYLQAAADRTLESDEKVALELHISGCSSCQGYANDLKNVEAALSRAMNLRWNAVPKPLSVDDLVRRKSGIAFQHTLQTAGLSMLVVTILIVITFLTRGLLSSDGTAGTQIAAVTATIIPTPSTQRTDIAVSASDCSWQEHSVQPGDTLESISQKYSLRMEEIMQVNDLTSEALTVGAKLIIPVCQPPPSITPVNTLTLTVTPPILITSRTP